MEKFKKFLPLVAFCLYFIKICIQPISYPEAAILAILGAIFLFNETRIQTKEIKALVDKVEGRQKELETYVKDIDSLKSSVASIKLGSTMRGTGSIGR